MTKQDNTPTETLPPEVEAAARKLFAAFSRMGGRVDPAADAAGEIEIVATGVFEDDDIFESDGDDIDDFLEDLAEQDAEEREELVARGIVTQPKLPRIFRLVIENYNARMEIHSKGQNMSVAEWIQLKELYRDMKQSLRPGAERALSREPV